MIYCFAFFDFPYYFVAFFLFPVFCFILDYFFFNI